MLCRPDVAFTLLLPYAVTLYAMREGHLRRH